jgi:hypothetical protein
MTNRLTNGGRDDVANLLKGLAVGDISNRFVADVWLADRLVTRGRVCIRKRRRVDSLEIERSAPGVAI